MQMAREDTLQKLNAQDRSERQKRNSFLLKLLVMGKDHPEILDLLELTEDQKKEVKTVVDELQNAQKELRDKLKDEPQMEALVRSQTIRLRNELKDRVFDVLVDIQMEELANMNVLDVGLPHVLTDSKIGTALRLTEAQKSKLERESNRLAVKVEAQIHESRQNAHDVVYSVLDDGQEKLLNEIFGKDLLRNYSRQISTRTIFSHYRYFEDGPKNFPMKPVLETDISSK